MARSYLCSLHGPACSAFSAFQIQVFPQQIGPVAIVVSDLPAPLSIQQQASDGHKALRAITRKCPDVAVTRLRFIQGPLVADALRLQGLEVGQQESCGCRVVGKRDDGNDSAALIVGGGRGSSLVHM
ncbi:MAG: hypothetical protein DI561_03595 [Thauera sp.]|nr:MAG: hypothetical protein DI561_03595 [Thauera sp.]